VCGNGISGCSGFVVAHRDELWCWVGIVMCGVRLNVIVVCWGFASLSLASG